MKKLFAALLALTMFFALTACGAKGEDVTGKYLCVSSKYSDGPGEPAGEWVLLEKGGKGTYCDGDDSFEFDLEWKLDGETFKGAVTFLGMENPMEGTLKDGVLDVTYGDLTMRFVKEGAQAPVDSNASGGDTENPTAPERTGLAGHYAISEAVIEGETMTYSDLEMADMVDGTYLNMFDDGFGELAFTDEIADSFTYDESTGLLTFNPGETLAFTADGDQITVEFPDQEMTLTFKLAEDDGGATGNDNVAVAGSIADAFAGVNTFVGVPDEVLSGNWFGWILESECWGGHEEDFQAAWAYVDYNATEGKSYFDLYKDGDSETPALSMWIEESVDDTELIPDIGDEDAWVLQRYLIEAEEPLFNTMIQPDGSLYFSYEYATEDGDSGCLVEVFLRKDGAAWDEVNDVLPPRYEEYKAAITD